MDDYDRALAQANNEDKGGGDMNYFQCRIAARMAIFTMEERLREVFGVAQPLSGPSKKKIRQKLTRAAMDNLKNLGVV